MADGSRDARVGPQQMNDLTFNAPDNGGDHTKKCRGDTFGGDEVKLSCYVGLDASGTCERSERVVVAAAGDSDGADRKKRCFDRYDSSESSDR